MDLNTMRSILTVLAFVAFVGIVAWAYRRGGRPEFHAAAQLPFVETADPPRQPADTLRDPRS